MPTAQSLSDIKSELKELIRRNSDRGFLPYGGCNRVCNAMSAMLDDSLKLDNPKEAFDIHLYILIEAHKLIAHADTSSGDATDLVRWCIKGIEELCMSAPDENREEMFKEAVKAAKHKVFQEWEEYGYLLLKSAVPLIQTRKQAEAVYALFPILGPMYDGSEYPERYLITQAIVERLDGEAAADRYRREHLHVPEIRKIVVERALDARRYAEAEAFCLEAPRLDDWNRGASEWTYYLERIYAETGNREKQLEKVRWILKRGDQSFYAKLKEFYSSDEVWEQQKELILDELSKAYMSNDFAELLSQEGEWARLLKVVQASPYLVQPYGKALAGQFPAETYSIYESYIWGAAAAATDRKKYKGVCKLIRDYSGAGAKAEAKRMIQRLIEKYPRRVAMVDELQMLEKKLTK